MSQILNLHLHQGALLLNKLSFHGNIHEKQKFPQHKSCSFLRNNVVSESYHEVPPLFPGSSKVVKCWVQSKVYISSEVESDVLPHIQTLSRFPKEELLGKVVMVRFDSTIFLGEELDLSSRSVCNAIYTIKYLHRVGAKVILVSDWSMRFDSKLLSADSFADILSSALQNKVVMTRCISRSILLKREDLEKADIHLFENLSEYKEEVANCSKFAELLSSVVDIFVNDSFPQCHKILASTVGICRFCNACIAGFAFEESLRQLKNIAKTNNKPYVAIIGGGNLRDKAAALSFLASRCDALVFIGLMSFQIMHALGRSVPSNLIERGAHEAALGITKFAHLQNVQILFPKDFWCMNHDNPEKMGIFPADGLIDGWEPIDVGPRSLDDINSLVMNSKVFKSIYKWSSINFGSNAFETM